MTVKKFKQEIDERVFPGCEDDESRDAAAEGGSGAAGRVDGAAAEGGDDGHGAHEGAHQVARPQGEHLLAGVHALSRGCGSWSLRVS